MSMIGQYELRELIGEGGIGQVHAAFDTVLERHVAIKSLRPELLSDKSFVERFRGEATSLARLNHPNITTLYQLLAEDRNLYMVMELVRGDTVDIILQKRKRALGVREALAIIAQAADGLSYAHSMGVIHRDIKPANLMITEGGLLKVMDFGIARVRGSQRLTRDGNMVGTLAYMAPEQLRGQPGDERTDLYSLAIVLYELLTGQPPFQSPSDYELMQAHMNTRPARLLHRVPGLDAKVDLALMRALAKDPEQRFASVRAFSDALGATSLRIDASSIVIEATRLLSRPDIDSAVPQPPVSGRLDRLFAALDRLVPWLPEPLRIPAAVGLSTLGVASVLVAAFLAMMPSPVPTSAPASPPAAARGLPPPPAIAAVKNPAPPSGTRVAMAMPEPAAASTMPPPRSPPTPPPPAALGEATVVVPGPRSVAAPAAQTPLPDPVAVPVRQTPPVTIPAAEARHERMVVPVFEAPPAAPQSSSVDSSNAGPAAAPPASPEISKADMAAAFTRKAYAEAFTLAQPLAQRGDRDAEFSVAWLYQRGEGVSRDDQQAAAWYQKAADKGHLLAQYNLGLMYEQGRGVEQSYEQALKWFRKAAEQGDADAQNDVGIMYALGQGTRKDEFEAVIWYSKAAKQGHAKAQKNLGDMYATGRGTDRDEREALRFYRQAAEQKHAEAEYNIGYFYETGRAGLKRDYDAAAQWYGRAVEHGSTKGQEALDRLRSRGRRH